MQIPEQIPLGAIDNEKHGTGTGQRRELAKQAFIRTLRIPVATQADARVLVQVIDRRVKQYDVEGAVATFIIMQPIRKQLHVCMTKKGRRSLERRIHARGRAGNLGLQADNLRCSCTCGVEGQHPVTAADIEHRLAPEVDAFKKIIHIESMVAASRSPLRDLKVTIE